MKSCWIIVPYEEKDKRGKSFKEIFDYDIKNDTIALGASSLVNTKKNVPKLTEEELKQEMRALNPDFSEKQINNKAKAIWQFYHLIKEGDTIIVKKGLREILAIGKAVIKNGELAYFDKKKGLERTGNGFNPYPNFLNVSWKRVFTFKFKEYVFRQSRFGAAEDMVIRSKQNRIMPIIEKEVHKTFGRK